jgi:hypothetical protein
MKPWNPIAGKLYRNVYTIGFLFNTQPKPSNYCRVFVKPDNTIPFGAIFMFLGGPGSCQRVPQYYWAYKILWEDRLGWLIYPEVAPWNSDRTYLSYQVTYPLPRPPVEIPT